MHIYHSLDMFLHHCTLPTAVSVDCISATLHKMLVSSSYAAIIWVVTQRSPTILEGALHDYEVKFMTHF